MFTCAIIISMHAYAYANARKKKLLDERILNVSQSLFAKKSRFFVNDAMKILGIRGLQRGASPNTVEANCTLFSPSAIK